MTAKDAVFLGLCVVGAVITVVVLLLRSRKATAAWTEVARALGGRLDVTPTGRVINVVVDGRPMQVRTLTRGSGRNSQVYTMIFGIHRHLDDLAAGTPAPPPDPRAWVEADADANARAGLADLPRPPLPEPPAPFEQHGVLRDPAELRELIRAEAESCARFERPIALWTAAATALGLKVRAAYLLEGEQRGCKVRVVADHVSAQIVVRAFGVARGEADLVALTTGSPPGGLEDVPRIDAALPAGYVAFARERGAARITEAARAALAVAKPTSVVAGARDVMVVIAGLTPDLEAWRAAVTLAVELAAVAGDGAFR